MFTAQRKPSFCLLARKCSSAFLCTRLLFYPAFHERDYYFVFPRKGIYIGYLHTKIFTPSVRISMHLLAEVTTREIKFMLLLVGREICPARRLFCLNQRRYHRRCSHEEQIMFWWLSFADWKNEEKRHYENINTDTRIYWSRPCDICLIERNSRDNPNAVASAWPWKRT